MGFDALIVVLYFVVIFSLAIKAKVGSNASIEEYYLSNRKLGWHSIAISTIATNIQGYQLLGMMGSAYLYGLAQANLEIVFNNRSRGSLVLGSLCSGFSL